MKFKDKYENDNYLIKKLKISDFNLLYDVGKNPSIWEQHPRMTRKLEKFKNYLTMELKMNLYLWYFDKKKIK